jgi:penicillin V acylase-like amidase (Ntn superfamily)
MDIMKIKILIISLLLLGFSIPAGACTAFILERDGKLILAKNLDWPIGEGYIFVNCKGEEKTSLSTDGIPTIKWESKYGSITFNQFGKEFPLGGINEKGLVIEELNYSPSKYPPNKTLYLNEMQWIQYQLDRAQSVTEVIESLDTISISSLINSHTPNATSLSIGMIKIHSRVVFRV